MTAKQNSYYWRLWGQLKNAKPGIDRKEFHRESGLPQSHDDFGHKDFDRYIAAVNAIVRPDDYRGQIRQQEMPQIRLRRAVSNLLWALDLGEDYALGIVGRMNAGGRIGQPWKHERAENFDYAHTVDGSPARKELTLEDLSEDELHKIVVALKKACKRAWPKKQDLLDAIQEHSKQVDGVTSGQAMLDAINEPNLIDISKLPYEPLCVCLGALRRLISEGHDAAEPAAAVVSEPVPSDNIPF